MSREDYFDTLAPGQTVKMTGDVTTLKWLLPGVDSRTEENVGYRAGRLDDGYVIALLVQRLSPDDFEFSGTTLRSGGRLGAPAGSYAEDETRPLVRQGMQAEHGEAPYRALKAKYAGQVQTGGPKRLAKIFPKSGPLKHLPPRTEFPMGGGGLQWTLVRPCLFLVALKVENGSATTPDFNVSLGSTGAPEDYQARSRIRRYLETATA